MNSVSYLPLAETLQLYKESAMHKMRPSTFLPWTNKSLYPGQNLLTSLVAYKLKGNFNKISTEFTEKNISLFYINYLGYVHL